MYLYFVVRSKYKMKCKCLLLNLSLNRKLHQLAFLMRLPYLTDVLSFPPNQALVISCGMENLAA